MLHYPPYQPAVDGPGTNDLTHRRQRDLEASGRDPDYPARSAEFWAETERRWQAALAEPGADVEAILARKAQIMALGARAEVTLAAEAAHLARHGPAALAAARALVPDDPYGGHRPVWLVELGMACLDCDWLVSRFTYYYGSPTLAGREHRALHLDPPAPGLCEREPMPAYFYYPVEPGIPSAAPDAGHGWPFPADLAWGSQYEYELVCLDCLAGIERGNGETHAPPAV